MDTRAGLVPTRYPGHDPTSWIVSLRPNRSDANPFEPNGLFIERERSLSGRVVSSGGILLTNKECPWRCLMCDLWKHTLPYTVPLGAIPRQIDHALAAFGCQPEQLKLYNSGSFFDPAAIPVADYQPIAECTSFADHVIVESHPRLVGDKAVRLRDLLRGSMEVAMGLETVHPDVLPRLNKRVTLDQFAEAASFLRKHEIAVRAFVLVNPPFLRQEQAVEWAVESARFAFSCGVGVVSLIPTRAGNGALDRLLQTGEFTTPSLSLLEQSLDLSLQLRGGRVFADTWDLERFSSCPTCFKQRTERLAEINLAQVAVPSVPCSSCGAV